MVVTQDLEKIFLALYLGVLECLLDLEVYLAEWEWAGSVEEVREKATVQFIS